MTHLLDKEVTNAAELRAALLNISFLANYSVAAEGLVFDRDRRWILILRGAAAQDEVGKLEGIGGRAEGDGSFRDELLREIREEAGDSADIEVLDFLEVKSDVVTKTNSDGAPITKTWVIVSFVCLYRGGPLVVCEPEKNQGFVFIDDLADLDPGRLSSSCQQSLTTLRDNWDRVSRRLDAAIEGVVDANR